ncbi:hypothetical protein [Sphingobium sp. SYK-6]|uniref:hypothetical protein n=1 Tax=Sphingobium sp. (strain NBRC 103272 / SYK-6) TaxID=627192 RepID=UPI00059D6DD3|nr:hypothetical protein [Sphingobium sp. SYK-6]
MKLVQLDPEAVALMQRHLDGRTDERLNARFGISYNTWRKIAAGQGVRSSVADRLLARLSSLDPGPRRCAND